MAYNANEPRDRSGKWTAGAKAAAAHAGKAVGSVLHHVGKASVAVDKGYRNAVKGQQDFVKKHGHIAVAGLAAHAFPGTMAAAAGGIVAAGAVIAVKSKLDKYKSSKQNNKVISKGTHANRTKGTNGPLHHDISKKQRKR